MLKTILDIAVIGLLALALFTHLVRLINLIFKTNFLGRFGLGSNSHPTRMQLILYYLLVVFVCLYAIGGKMEWVL
jgi:hypothetical protein